MVIVTDENVTKLRVDNVMNLVEERPMNLVHGQRDFPAALADFLQVRKLTLSVEKPHCLVLPFYSNHGYSNRSCFNYSKSDRRPQVKSGGLWNCGIMELWNSGIAGLRGWVSGSPLFSFVENSLATATARG